METNLALVTNSSSQIQASSLAEGVKDFADRLFQQHYLDCTERPQIIWKAFKRKESYQMMTDRQLSPYSSYISEGLDKVLSYYKKEYFLFRTSLEQKYQNYLPFKVQHPKFAEAKEAMSWCLQHLRELSEEFHFYSRQERFISEFNNMPYLQIAREYPSYLRFKPCSFSLPDSEDAGAWAARTDAYLSKKFVASNIAHPLSCYKHKEDPPSIGFYRVLTMNKELADKLVGNIQKNPFFKEMTVLCVEPDLLM